MQTRRLLAKFGLVCLAMSLSFVALAQLGAEQSPRQNLKAPFEFDSIADKSAACHTDRNFNVPAPSLFQCIPGHPRWQLAPLSMAWEGKSLGEICRQIKDRGRNGGRDLAMLQEHIATDDLVAWGWDPGLGRESAPGTQQAAGKLVQAWIDSGAICP